jgi:hypothetical protein
MYLSQTTESFGTQDQSWVASRHGLNNCKPATLAVSTFTAGTHYPNGELLSGLPIAKVTATGRYGPYDGAASDGRQNLAGHLLSNVEVPAGATVVVGAVLLHGFVKLALLPVTVDVAGQADVAGRIIYS